MDLVRIEQQDGQLIFERFKRSEIVFVNNEEINKTEIYVNIETDNQSEQERKEISTRYAVTLNEDILYAMPRLQFMNLEPSFVAGFLAGNIEIPKGWSNENLMAGIYVGWGIETFDNSITLEKNSDLTYKLIWHCIADDLNFYDDRAKRCKVNIEVMLTAMVFDSKKDFLKYEADKINGLL